jgi:hypothetical protein
MFIIKRIDAQRGKGGQGHAIGLPKQIFEKLINKNPIINPKMVCPFEILSKKRCPSSPENLAQI